jgi:hypothetical protein
MVNIHKHRLSLRGHHCRRLLRADHILVVWRSRGNEHVLIILVTAVTQFSRVERTTLHLSRQRGRPWVLWRGLITMSVAKGQASTGGKDLLCTHLSHKPPAHLVRSAVL